MLHRTPFLSVQVSCPSRRRADRSPSECAVQPVARAPQSALDSPPKDMYICSASLGCAAGLGPMRYRRGTLNPEIEGSNPSKPSQRSTRLRGPTGSSASFALSIISIVTESATTASQLPPGGCLVSGVIKISQDKRLCLASRSRTGRCSPGDSPRRLRARFNLGNCAQYLVENHA